MPIAHHSPLALCDRSHHPPLALVVSLFLAFFSRLALGNLRRRQGTTIPAFFLCAIKEKTKTQRKKYDKLNGGDTEISNFQKQ